MLADKAYRDLEENAHEHLSLNVFLEKLSDPQVAFNVIQKCPKCLDNAVTVMLEIESYMIPTPAKVAQVWFEDGKC